jgi:HEAT repeat protein
MSDQSSLDYVMRLEAERDVRRLASAVTYEADPAARLHAIRALRRMGTPRRVRFLFEPLIAALNDTDTEVRWHAAGFLGRLGSPIATEPLLALFSTGVPSDSLAAALALNRLVPGWEQAAISSLGIAGLIQVRNQLPQLSGRGRFPPTPDELSEYKAELNALLLRIGLDRMTQSLLAALADPDHDLRADLAQALGELGGEQAAAALQTVRHDAIPAVRVVAVKMLGKMQSSTAAAAALDALTDPHPAVRAAGALVLGTSSEEGSRPALFGCLQDPVVDVRMAAAAALGAQPLSCSAQELLELLQGRHHLGPLVSLTTSHAEDPLRRELWKSIHAQRLAAARALAKQCERQAVPILRQILFEADDLRQLGFERHSSWRSALESELRHAAASALGSLGGSEAERALLDALEPSVTFEPHFDRALRRTIIDGLKTLGSARAMDALQQWIDDD